MSGSNRPPLNPATLKPDDLLTVGRIAKLAPGVSEANHSHRATVRRWIVKGVTIAGTNVKLPARRTPGGTALIRWGDYQWFVAECARLRGVPSEPIETPAMRQARDEVNRLALKAVCAGIRSRCRVR